MRRSTATAGLLALALAGSVPALAADQSVSARGSRFTPATVALKPGETITITHDDGLTAHDLQFSDEPARRAGPGTGWTVQRTFTAAEARAQPYTFFCSLHGGMSGRVYVNADGAVPAPSPAPTATATATATPAPTATAPPPGAGEPAGSAPSGGGTAPQATLRSLRLLSRTVCVRRCRKRGVRLRIDLSAPADVRGTLRRRAPGARRFSAFGTVRFGSVAAGPRQLRFARTAAGRRLAPGRYRLLVRAAGSERTLAFRVL